MEFYLFPMDGKVLFIVFIFAIYLSPELYGGRFFCVCSCCWGRFVEEKEKEYVGVINCY